VNLRPQTVRVFGPYMRRRGHEFLRDCPKMPPFPIGKLWFKADALAREFYLSSESSRRLGQAVLAPRTHDPGGGLICRPVATAPIALEGVAIRVARLMARRGRCWAQM
jgi:hypothetical protein